MRRAKVEAAQRLKNKPKQHTRSERLALRRRNRKEGPSAVRRKTARAARFPTLECGCRVTSTHVVPCGEHAATTPVLDEVNGNLL